MGVRGRRNLLQQPHPHPRPLPSRERGEPYTPSHLVGEGRDGGQLTFQPRTSLSHQESGRTPSTENLLQLNPIIPDHLRPPPNILPNRIHEKHPFATRRSRRNHRSPCERRAQFLHYLHKLGNQRFILNQIAIVEHDVPAAMAFMQKTRLARRNRQRHR